MIVVVGLYVRMSIFLTLMIGQNCSLLVPDWLGEVYTVQSMLTGQGPG